MTLTHFGNITLINVLVFSGLWAVLYRSGRVSWIDFFWSASIGVWSLVFLKEAFHLKATHPSFVLAGVTFVWSLRLSLHLLKRLLILRGEDRRYEEIKSRAPKNWMRKSFAIFMLNAILVSILLIPQLLLLVEASPMPLSYLQSFALLLCLISVCGEALADRQLKKFLTTNGGKTCQSGLWKYSRHPNYFFEWLFWVGVFLCALKAPHGLWAITAPLLMFVFLNYLTGIKISEKNAESRRPDFSGYKHKTSAFFPWPPRSHDKG